MLEPRLDHQPIKEDLIASQLIDNMRDFPGMVEGIASQIPTTNTNEALQARIWVRDTLLESISRIRQAREDTELAIESARFTSPDPPKQADNLTQNIPGSNIYFAP